MRLLFFLFSIFGWASVQAQPMLAREACEIVVGDWQGTYRAGPTSFLTEDYWFRGAYDENGVVMIDFTFYESGERDRHEGYWYCQDGVLTTALVSEAGTGILFQYRILEITSQKWRYQLLSTRPDAPIFEADRTSPGAMTPEFMDEYSRSFFDALLPPDIRQ